MVRIDDENFDDTEKALLARLESEGRIIAESESEEGWGHHSNATVVELDGKFYGCESSGCSCGGSGNIGEPRDTFEKALGDVSEYYREDLLKDFAARPAG